MRPTRCEYSDNPMIMLDFIPTRRVSLPNSTQHNPFASPPSFRGKPWLLRQVLRLLPRSYYHSPRDRKLVAPTWVSISVSFLEIAACVGMFVGMVFYFYNHTTPHTTISITPLPGQSCSVLNPRRGTVHYNRTNSENAQFAGLYTTSQQQCEAALEAARVCEDGVRHDHLTLWGVTNPNNTQLPAPQICIESY